MPEKQAQLEALELLFYADRYRRLKLVVTIDSELGFQELVNDIRSIHLAHIPAVYVLHSFENYQQATQQFARRGLPLHAISAEESLSIEIESTWANNKIPLVFINEESSETTLNLVASKLAEELSVKRVFITGEASGLFVNDTFKRFLSIEELQSLEESSAPLPKETIKFLDKTISEKNKEFVFLQAKEGQLFAELFTHKGSGTLVAHNAASSVRQAKITDVVAISAIIYPLVQTGAILEISEDEVAQTIEQFFVYDTNGVVVAAARFRDFENWCELGKFCTIPRYQGKGLARELANALIKKATELEKEGLFALVTSPRMGDFFKQIGFTSCPREELPLSWQKQYNFERPSRALRLKLRD